eukprot:365540-Chlamydomonas_euryale.AAC.17
MVAAMRTPRSLHTAHSGGRLLPSHTAHGGAVIAGQGHHSCRLLPQFQNGGRQAGGAVGDAAASWREHAAV